MLEAAVKTTTETAKSEGLPRPKILAVTVLTSIGQERLNCELRVPGSVGGQVVHLAQMAYEAGCDGIISSPHEIELVRSVVPDPNFLIITPGVRPAGADKGDQARIMTPSEALQRGANLLVIGRPIIAAPDPVAAAIQIAHEINRTA
jgi:orotidine-5'-phosphate decarboxylase